MTVKNPVHALGSRRGLFYSLRSKILASFGALLVATVIAVNLARTFGIPFTHDTGAYGQHEAQALRNLGFAADLKKERLAFWLAERVTDARLLSETSWVRASVDHLLRTVEAGRTHGKDSTGLKADLIEDEGARALTQHLQLMFDTWLAHYKLIQVADARTGLVLASTDVNDVGTEISERQPFLQAILSPRGIWVDVTRSAAEKKPYLIIYSTIRSEAPSGADEEPLSAILLTYVDTEEYLKPLLYMGEGLGRTGDIVLVNGDQRILIPLKYPLPDGTVPEVLHYRIEAEPARLAATGEEGVIMARDYRGIPVLAAHRHIVVTPDIGWGLVVKRDKAEVFQPIWQRLIYSSSIALVGLVVGLLLVTLLTNKISRPVQELSRAATEVGTGNLSARARVTSFDEVGDLAAGFNSMIERVEHWHKELEEQVKARTFELARERQHLAVTLRSIGDGVISTDTQGRILSLNQTAEELTGWSEEEALGRPLEEIFHIINEKTRERCENPVRKVLQSGAIVGLANDTVLMSRDGTERVLADTGAPIRGENDDVLGVVLVFTDITESKRAGEALRRSERELRGILAASPVGIGLTRDRKVVWANRAWIEMFGFAHESEYIGQSTSILHPSYEQYKAARKLLYGRMQEGRVGQTEATMKRKDGTLFHALIRATPADPLDLGQGTISTIEDISEIREAQERLQESETRYRAFFDLASDCIYVLEIEGENPGRIISANPMAAQLHGYTLDEILTMNIADLDTPKSAEKTPERFERLLRGERLRDEVTHHKKDGTVFPLEINAGLIELGGRKYILTIERDITERKRAEEALRIKDAALESSMSATAITDFYGTLNYVNPSCVQLWRYGSAGDMLGKAAAEFWHDPEQARKVAREALKTGSWSGELLARRKDGSTFISDVVLTVVKDKSDKPTCLMGSFLDISTRKKTEQALRRLATAVEQAAEAIIITDTQGTIAYANPALERLSGYTRDELIGQNPRMFSSGQQTEAFYKDMWDTITRGNVWNGRMINRRKDGSLWHEETTISPVRDSSGAIVNFVGVERDITEEVSLQQQLFQAQKMEAIGTLAGGIAHDFNNLLQVTLGYSEMLLSEITKDDANYADLQRISQAAKSGADLVQRLLTFSRKVEPKPIPLNLNQQIKRIGSLLSRTIPRMVDIDLDLADDLAKISADPTQMEQVVMNIAVNARDAMPEGGKLIVKTRNVLLDEAYCATHLGVKPGEYVALIVSDSGHGMRKETLEHIFEPFYTTKALGRGTGLGLAIVYGIVQQHGGHVTCESEVGRGTTFTAYFPALEGDIQPRVKESLVVPPRGTETLLLVDDEDVVRDLGERILAHGGYTVLTARNGREAVEVYRREKERISLVILDLIMPEMGGKECLRDILKIDPNARVLVASGHAAGGSTRESLEIGAKGFLEKPFRVNALLSHVRKFIDSD